MKHPSWGGCCCEGGGVSELKIAVQVMLSFSVTLVPQPAPLQPTKVEPLWAVAESAMSLLSTNCAWHDVPQSIPTGVDRTLPMPVPPLLTVRVRMPPTSVPLAVLS